MSSDNDTGASPKRRRLNSADDEAAEIAQVQPPLLALSDLCDSKIHPQSLETAHIKRSDFEKNLNDALEGVFPTKPRRYEAVTAVLLCWDRDDLGCVGEVDALQRLFEDTFHFNTERWMIQSQDTYNRLERVISDFKQSHQRPDELVIFYYGGHGKFDEQGRSVWQCASGADSPTLEWFVLQPSLERAIPDTLFIIDSCYAASVARDSKMGVKELLAACGRESMTAGGVLSHSFTTVLIQEIKSFGVRPFSVVDLHSRLVRERTLLRKTPVYARLAKGRCESIVIRPLPGQAQAGPSTASSSTDTVSENLDQSESSPSKATNTPHSSVTKGRRVLISVSLTDDGMEPDDGEWLTWLSTGCPQNIMQVQVQLEGIYESDSTLLLISLPVSVWDLLPDHPAYSFVGFTRSGNSAKVRLAESKTRGRLPMLPAAPDERKIWSRPLESSRPKDVLRSLSCPLLECFPPNMFTTCGGLLRHLRRDHKVAFSRFGNNALALASLRGDESLVRHLVSRGVDVNAPGGVCGSALQAAICKGHYNIGRLLAEHGASGVDTVAEGDNILGEAVLAGSEGTVRLLVKGGADVNESGGYFGNALQAAAFEGHEGIVRFLIGGGADVNTGGGFYGNALQAAAYRGHWDIVQLLLEEPVDVNASGGCYGSALQAAAYGGRWLVARLLVGHGADVSAQGGPYGSALQAAACRGHWDVAQLLVERGADVNARGGPYGDALQAAAYEGHLDVVELLVEHKVDVNFRGGPYGSALQAAAYGGHWDVVRLLVECEADVNAGGGPYGGALQAAAYIGHKSVVRLLVGSGADVSTGGPYGNALLAATYMGHESVVRLLVERGAGANVGGKRYDKAPQEAIRGDHSDTVQPPIKYEVARGAATPSEMKDPSESPKEVAEVTSKLSVYTE